jgi:predicted lipoprotein with Yx(FWY)xxD motif
MLASSVTPTSSGPRHPTGDLPVSRAFLGLALVAMAAGVGGSGSSTSPSGGSATVNTANSTSLGTILVSGSGRTLYDLVSPAGKPGPCSAACEALWPPLTVASGSTPTAGAGVTRTLAVTTGTRQVTYDGLPLCRYSGGTASGQVKGDGIQSFGGVWHALAPSGHAATSSGGTTTTRAGGGY